MITAVAFAAAAIVGALARAEAGRRWNRPGGFPAGTLVVNVTGSFLLGLLAGAAPPAFTVWGVAALGTYTTFSTFARDTVALAQRQPARAAGYVAATCLLGILAAAAGVVIADP